jgi:hypothetical protein
VNATAISSVRLNCTDDLTTQVDYYLNEVINLIYVQSFILSSIKHCVALTIFF